MKKILPLIAGILGISLCILVYSCSKHEINTDEASAVPDNLLAAAQAWQTAHTQPATTLSLSTAKKQYILPPNWKEAKLQKGNNSTTQIIVSSPDFPLSTKSTQGAERKFVYTVTNGQVTDGVIVETFASKDYMDAHKGSVVSSVSTSPSSNFTGVAITYDVNYKYRGGIYYKNGQPRGRATIKGDNGQHRNAKSGFGEPISTLDNCYDRYLVITYDDGSSDWTYLYSYCTFSGSDNEYGGWGGGGGSTYNFSANHTIDISNVPALGADLKQTWDGSCPFMNAEIIGDILGLTLNEQSMIDAYALATSRTVDDVEANGISIQSGAFNTVQDFSKLNNFVNTYFNATSVQTYQMISNLDNGHPLMAFVVSGIDMNTGQFMGHEITIFGYNTDNIGNTTYRFFDTSDGSIKQSDSGTVFSDLISISKK